MGGHKQVSGVVNIQQNKITDQNGAQPKLPFANSAAGDVLEASVVSVKGNRVTLAMQDGTTVEARFASENIVQKGDSVALSITEKNGNTVRLQLSTINGQTVNLDANETQVFLMKMGVAPSSLNQNAAQVLSQYGIRPTPTSIANLAQIAATFPELPTNIAVFMAENNIAPTKENVAVITKWVSENGSLDSDIAQLTTLLKEGGQATQNNSVAQSGKVALNVALNTAEGFVKSVVSDNRIPNTPQITALFESAAFKEGLASLKGMPQEQADAQIAKLVANLPPAQKEIVSTVIKDLYIQAKAQEVQAGSGMSAETLTGNTQNSTVAQEVSQVLSTLDKLFMQVKPNGSVEASQVEQAVKNLPQLAESIRGDVARIAGENSPAAQKAGDVAAQVRMGAQMENFYYFQIPMDNNGKKQNAELFVFEKNAKRKVGEKENITVLIALDTQNLGRIETVLRSADNKLEINFRVENEEVVAYLKNSKADFIKTMRESGFTIESVMVQTMEEKATPLNAREIVFGNEVADITGIDIQV